MNILHCTNISAHGIGVKHSDQGVAETKEVILQPICQYSETLGGPLTITLHMNIQDFYIFLKNCNDAFGLSIEAKDKQ